MATLTVNAQLSTSGDWSNRSLYRSIIFNVSIEGKAITATGRGGPYNCETLRLPHFLDNRLTDGGEAVSFMSRPFFVPGKIHGTHIC
jgi:hypothetical protein